MQVTGFHRLTAMDLSQVPLEALILEIVKRNGSVHFDQPIRTPPKQQKERSPQLPLQTNPSSSQLPPVKSPPPPAPRSPEATAPPPCPHFPWSNGVPGVTPGCRSSVSVSTAPSSPDPTPATIPTQSHTTQSVVMRARTEMRTNVKTSVNDLQEASMWDHKWVPSERVSHHILNKELLQDPLLAYGPDRLTPEDIWPNLTKNQ